MVTAGCESETLVVSAGDGYSLGGGTTNVLLSARYEGTTAAHQLRVFSYSEAPGVYPLRLEAYAASDTELRAPLAVGTSITVDCALAGGCAEVLILGAVTEPLRDDARFVVSAELEIDRADANTLQVAVLRLSAVDVE